MNIRPYHLAALGLACGFALAAIGCKSARIGGTAGPDKVIDELRQENAQLQRDVERLNRQIEVRLAELEALRADKGVPAPDAGGAAVPRLHEVRIAGFSGAVDSDGDGRDDLIRLYVVTRDQHGRTLPIEGRAVVQAVHLAPERDPAVVASRTFEPDEFRAQYRSGFAGTHYTLELQLPTSEPPSPVELTIHVTVTDAATGIALTDQKPIRIKAPS